MAFKILTLNPTGFFCFSKHKTINLDNLGTVLLEGINLDRSGNSNGSGKSSIFHSIVQILFGRNPPGESADKTVNQFLGKSFGRITLLDKSNKKWRITDTRKWRKTDKYPTETFEELEEPSEIHNSGSRYSGTDVYLESWDQAANIWRDERASNKSVGDTRLDVKSTRKKIVEVLGMDYGQFMSIAYLAQQQTLKFLEGTHKEKLQVIGELGDLKLWDERIAKIKADISQNESERDRLEAKLAGLGQLTFTKPDESIKAKLVDDIQLINESIAECDSELKTLVQKSSDWNINITSINGEISYTLNNIKAIQDKHKDIQSQIDAAASTYMLNCEKVRSKPRPFELDKLNTEISELNGQKATRRYDLEQLLTGAGKCPRCRTNVSTEHILRHRELLNLDIKTLEDQTVALKEKLNKLSAEWESDVIRQLSDLEATHQDQKYQLTYIQSFYNSQLNVYTTKFNSLQQKLRDLGQDPKMTTYGVEQRRLASLAQRSMKEMCLDQWQTQTDKFNEYEQITHAARISVGSLNHTIKHLSVLEKLFGDKGIKAFKLNNLLIMLNQALDKYIDIMSDGNLKVWVTQYREKSDGDVAADLQIMVRDNQKNEVPFGLYSGGERQQIMLAFIGAFWQLASKCDAGVNIMCLDEVAANLDNYNTQLFFNFIETMRTHGSATSMLVVTHNTAIKDQVKFSQVWTVTRKNGTSLIEPG
jgi:DNA repair exonuclease SbcCD ATPase subunit